MLENSRRRESFLPTRSIIWDTRDGTRFSLTHVHFSLVGEWLQCWLKSEAHRFENESSHMQTVCIYCRWTCLFFGWPEISHGIFNQTGQAAGRIQPGNREALIFWFCIQQKVGEEVQAGSLVYLWTNQRKVLFSLNEWGKKGEGGF